ncbi:PspA/IM30 family protein [Paenibacillus sp. LMG 31459]|uniref:PspA/IM30 family protein n=1 Tax=Paenibacillus phytohabitans TaxID=2654978 RepID=A0ABX1YD59_9BACL|nr:PspA/IM30 family protein [Paenibacillus phytohabitans]NOU78915.1 PspA/IM30 family protein [Paenibacillus phytohabitans]
MSIFQRITTLTKAAIHEGLNKLEDPMLLTGQYLRDLEDKITDAESKQREFKAAASVLERRIYEYQVLAERSEAEAVQAMSEGNEPAARAAVMAKLRYTESGQECTAGLQETQATLASLEVQLANVKEEHKRLKAKRAELAERARKAAEIKQAAQASASGSPAGCRGQVLNAGSASRGFERMEDKIAMQEALAEQSGLTAAAAPDAPLNSAVEAELERLRNRK